MILRHMSLLGLISEVLGDNFLSLLVRRRLLFPCFRAVGCFATLFTVSRGPFFFLTARLFISTEGDSKSEMILIKCFCPETFNKQPRSFKFSCRSSSPLSVLVKLQTIDLIIKDKDKYQDTNDVKRDYIIMNMFNYILPLKILTEIYFTT